MSQKNQKIINKIRKFLMTNKIKKIKKYFIIDVSDLSKQIKKTKNKTTGIY